MERYARVYESCDKCVQTDDLPAGEDASAQFPSIQVGWDRLSGQGSAEAALMDL